MLRFVQTRRKVKHSIVCARVVCVCRYPLTFTCSVRTSPDEGRLLGLLDVCMATEADATLDTLRAFRSL